MPKTSNDISDEIAKLNAMYKDGVLKDATPSGGDEESPKKKEVAASGAASMFGLKNAPLGSVAPSTSKKDIEAVEPQKAPAPVSTPSQEVVGVDVLSGQEKTYKQPAFDPLTETKNAIKDTANQWNDKQRIITSGISKLDAYKKEYEDETLPVEQRNMASENYNRTLEDIKRAQAEFEQVKKRATELQLRKKALEKPGEMRKEAAEKAFEAEYIALGLMAGSNKLASRLLRTPEFLYDIAAIPQNLVAKYTGLDVGTSSAQLGKTIGIENVPAQYYEDAYKNAKAKIYEKYDKGISDYIANGDYAKAAALTAISVAEFAPTSISLALGNAAGVGAVGSMLAGGAVFGADKMQEINEKYPEMSEADKAAIALSSGLLEGFFEQFGITKLGGIAKGAVEKMGKDAAKDVIEKSFKEAYMPIAKKYLGVMAEESIGEAATQFSQNAVDKYSGYKPEQELLSGVVDAAILGLASSKVMSLPTLSAEIYTESKNREKAKQLIDKQNAIRDDLQNKELLPEVKQALVQSSQKINEQLADMMSEDKKKYDALSQEDKDVIDSKRGELSNIEKAMLDETLSEGTKSGLADSKAAIEEEVGKILSKKPIDEKREGVEAETRKEEKSEGEVGEMAEPMGEGVEPKKAGLSKEYVETQDKAGNKYYFEKDVATGEAKSITLDEYNRLKTEQDATKKREVQEGVSAEPKEVAGREQATQAGTGDIVQPTERGQKEEVVPTPITLDNGEFIDNNLYNESIDVINKSIDESKMNEAQAVYEGLKHIKRSEWYGSLDENSRQEFDDKYINNSNRIFENRKAKPVRSVDTSMPVVTTEKKALREKMKNLQRGFMAGIKRGKEALSFTSKQAKIFAERVNEIMDSKENPLRGKLNGRQVSSILKRANNIKSYEELRRFDDYVQKVIDNENYAEDLRSAMVAKKKISKKIRVKDKKAKVLANNLDTQKAFLKINPSEVDDISEYNRMAERIVSNQKGVTYKSGAIQGEEYAVANKEVNDYVEKTLAEIEQKKKGRLSDDYNYLVEQGVIDKNGMSLKEMQYIIDAATESEEALDNSIEDKTKQKEEAFKGLVDFRLSELDLYIKDKGDSLSKLEKKVAGNLVKIDTENLTAKQLVRLNDILNNIMLNDSFVGSGYYSLMSEAQQSIKEIQSLIKKSGITLGNIDGAIVSSMTSKDMLFDFLAKSNKLASEIKRLSGVDAIYDGHAKSKISQGDLFKAYNDLKDGMSKDIDSTQNRIARGIYAKVSQYIGADTINEDFANAKKQIYATADNLIKSGTKEEVAEGNEIMVAYNNILKDSDTAEEVKKKVDEMNPGNSKIVDFFIEQYDKYRDDFLEQSEIYGNEIPERWNNYTSTKMKTYGTGEDVAADEKVTGLEERPFYNKDIHSKESKTRVSRVKGGVDKNMVLNLDFDKVQFERFYEMLYDMNTLEPINKFKNIIDGKGANDTFGGVDNKKVIRNTVKTSIETQKGEYVPSDIIEKAITKVFNGIGAKGARIALFGITQPIKQSMVLLNTAANLGKDINLITKVANVPLDIPLLKQRNIGIRGEVQAGLNKRSIIQGVKSMMDNGLGERTAGKINDIANKITDAIASPLVSTDVFQAKRAWMAYYLKSLKDQGLSTDIDWVNEHNNPNEVAASYAQHMVSKTQGAMDSSSMAQLYKNMNKGSKKAVMGAIMPFNSFGLNARTRMSADVKRIFTEGNKQEAFLSLIGTISEMVGYNALKALLISPVIGGAANMILESFGIDGDDEDKGKVKIDIGGMKFDTHNDYKKWVAGSMKDILFSGMGAPVDMMSESLMNKLYSAYSTEEYMRNGRWKQRKNPPSLFYSPENQSILSLPGIYGILPKKLVDMSKQIEYLDGSTAKLNAFYADGRRVEKEKEVKLTDKEKQLLYTTFTLDALSILGLSDADLLRLNDRVKFGLEKHFEEKYKGRKMEKSITPFEMKLMKAKGY